MSALQSVIAAHTQRPTCHMSKALDNVFLEVTSFGLRP